MYGHYNIQVVKLPSPHHIARTLQYTGCQTTLSSPHCTDTTIYRLSNYPLLTTLHGHYNIQVVKLPSPHHIARTLQYTGCQTNFSSPHCTDTTIYRLSNYPLLTTLHGHYSIQVVKLPSHHHIARTLQYTGCQTTLSSPHCTDTTIYRLSNYPLLTTLHGHYSIQVVKLPSHHHIARTLQYTGCQTTLSSPHCTDTTIYRLSNYPLITTLHRHYSIQVVKLPSPHHIARTLQYTGCQTTLSSPHCTDTTVYRLSSWIMIYYNACAICHSQRTTIHCRCYSVNKLSVKLMYTAHAIVTLTTQ